MLLGFIAAVLQRFKRRAYLAACQGLGAGLRMGLKFVHDRRITVSLAMAGAVDLALIKYLAKRTRAA